MIKPLLTSTGHAITDAAGMPLYEESDFTPPDGIPSFGALIRDDAPGDSCELWRDVFPKEVIDPSDWKQFVDAGAGDHRSYVNWIYNQGSVGSCASEGLHGCVDSQRERRGLPKVKFNPYPIYYYASGGRDVGSTLVACIREAKARGMVPAKLWPRSQHRWNDLPPASVWAEAKKYKPDEVYDIGNSVESASALFRGHSVYAAYPGHAWQLISVLNTQQAMWRNSWGDDWDGGGGGGGGDGFGVISFSRITFQYGLFAIQTTTAGA